MNRCSQYAFAWCKSPEKINNATRPWWAHLTEPISFTYHALLWTGFVKATISPKIKKFRVLGLILFLLNDMRILSVLQQLWGNTPRACVTNRVKECQFMFSFSALQWYKRDLNERKLKANWHWSHTYSIQDSFFVRSASTNSSSEDSSFKGFTFFSFVRLRTVPRTMYSLESTSCFTTCIARKPDAPVTRTRVISMLLVESDEEEGQI